MALEYVPAESQGIFARLKMISFDHNPLPAGQTIRLQNDPVQFFKKSLDPCG